METPPGLAHEFDVARVHGGFAFGGHARQSEFAGDRAFVHVSAAREFKDFGVGVNRKIVGGCALQKLTHQGFGFYREAVVGKSNSTCFEQGIGVGEFFTLHFFGCTGDGIYTGICRFCLLDDVLDDFWAVHRRFCIGQTGHRCEASGSSGFTSGFDGFFFWRARIAQVDVHIDEAWYDDLG